MLFPSFEFVVYFLPAVLLTFAALAAQQRRFAPGKILLILASAFFYAWWSLRDALASGKTRLVFLPAPDKSVAYAN